MAQTAASFDLPWEERSSRKELPLISTNITSSTFAVVFSSVAGTNRTQQLVSPVHGNLGLHVTQHPHAPQTWIITAAIVAARVPAHPRAAAAGPSSGPAARDAPSCPGGEQPPLCSAARGCKESASGEGMAGTVKKQILKATGGYWGLLPVLPCALPQVPAP